MTDPRVPKGLRLTSEKLNLLWRRRLPDSYYKPRFPSFSYLVKNAFLSAEDYLLKSVLIGAVGAALYFSDVIPNTISYIQKQSEEHIVWNLPRPIGDVSLPISYKTASVIKEGSMALGLVVFLNALYGLGRSMGKKTRRVTAVRRAFVENAPWLTAVATEALLAHTDGKPIDEVFPSAVGMTEVVTTTEIVDGEYREPDFPDIEEVEVIAEAPQAMNSLQQPMQRPGLERTIIDVPALPSQEDQKEISSGKRNPPERRN